MKFRSERRFWATASLGLSLCAGLFPACAPEEKRAASALDYSENARKEYELGVQAIEAENWEGATEILNEVRRKYAYSRYGRLAELRLADADFLQQKYAEAITGYKSFVHDYPNDPEVPYARYRVARAQWDSVSESALMPPLEERDLAFVNDALTTINEYLNDFPGNKYRDELLYLRAVVMGLLARHELYVARYYLAEDRFEAAIARCEYALSHFERSGLEAEALVLLGEVYLKQKEPEKARKSLERVLTDFPASPFTQAAKNFLALVGPKAKRDPSAPAEPETTQPN
jgi:outer membrane protein assembly factor BamD